AEDEALADGRRPRRPARQGHPRQATRGRADDVPEALGRRGRPAGTGETKGKGSASRQTVGQPEVAPYLRKRTQRFAGIERKKTAREVFPPSKPHRRTRGVSSSSVV